MEVFFLMAVKILDSMITTGKSILTHKNKAFLASTLIVLSQVIFYFVVAKVVQQDSFMTIILVALSAGLGSYLAFMINRRFSKDRLYINIITAKDAEDMKNLSDYVRANNIKIITMNSYTPDLETTLTALIFANTKEQSEKIDDYIQQSQKNYLRQIIE